MCCKTELLNKSSCLYICINGHDLIFFNNKDIIIDGKRFFLSKWKEKGAVLIQDILDNDGKALTFIIQNSTRHTDPNGGYDQK